VFIYTREAHPGENVPHHDSFERKLACAKLLREEAGIGRDILVDDLAGTVHRAYRLMPNMTWVIARGGRIAYKANWTSAANVEAFLERFLAARGKHPAGAAPVMYETAAGRVPVPRPEAVHAAPAAQRPAGGGRVRESPGTVGPPASTLTSQTSQNSQPCPPR
jgi:hypothetical protein